MAFWNHKSERSVQAEAFPDKEESSELFDENIVARNLAEMNSSMNRLLTNESMGGNAGTAEIEGKMYSCAAANGYANSETGEFIVFGNFQNVSHEIREKYQSITLRVALVIDRKKMRGYEKIVEILGTDHFSNRARETISESVERWNEERVKKSAA